VLPELLYERREVACLSLFHFAKVSMSKRVCIFVDGENFRHAILDLFDEFAPTDYLPHNAQWEKIFDWLVLKTDTDGKIVRTYWYVIEEIDFYPYKFPDANAETDRLKKVLCKDKNCKDRLNDPSGIQLTGMPLIEKMNKLVDDLKKKQNLMTQRFKGWLAVQMAISTNHRFIEFRRAGAIQYNLFDGKFGSEKAVDVKLATDMIMLKDIYDIAIIVSGDQDYVPAVKAIKDFGKHAVNVAFETRGGKLLPGGAWRLNHVTDWSLKIPHADFKGFLNLH
jgi:uncharacterized LabA/DUF88 family protein